VAHCALCFAFILYPIIIHALLTHRYPTIHKVSRRALAASQMDSLQPLRSPIILDSECSFDKTSYSNIQSWLSGIMSISEEESRLQSPIRLPEYPCPSISRKRRAGPRPSKRRCLARNAAWGLPPEHRFFDNANWMDEADRRVASLPVEEQCAWRDAYTVMISQPRSRTRSCLRRQRRLESSPYATISLPSCPPLDQPPSPRTPIRHAPSRFVYVDRSTNCNPTRPPALAIS